VVLCVWCSKFLYGWKVDERSNKEKSFFFLKKTFFPYSLRFPLETFQDGMNEMNKTHLWLIMPFRDLKDPHCTRVEITSSFL